MWHLSCWARWLLNYDRLREGKCRTLPDLLLNPDFSSRGDAGAGIAHRHIECALVRAGFDDHFAGIGEFDRVAHNIEQNLREPLFTAAGSRQIWRYLG